VKYTILINQVGVVEAGLEGKTDLVDWAIIDYLQQWYFAERKKTVFVQGGANLVWVNYPHLIEEMPLLGIKNREAISARMKKLRGLGLIETFQARDNTLYFVLTPKCMRIVGFDTRKETKNDDLLTAAVQPINGSRTALLTAAVQHKQTTNKQTTNKEEGADAPFPLPEEPEENKNPGKIFETKKETAIEITPGAAYYLQAFGRKRFATLVQRDALIQCEREVGTAALVGAIDWAARNGIARMDSILTAARKMVKGSSNSKKGGKATSKCRAEQDEDEVAEGPILRLGAKRVTEEEFMAAMGREVAR